ncbi:MAG: flagellin [Planctomycetota bacterium]|nr:MAG: flagellin [Planctomycetota bacterium]REJ87077.1 MAG: flagellin [Planctomycetota bacterium]REK27005.1 MAG: flagellin [Planctomycetota bacterium]REK47268.1 MAG: flagellin [Planctomycetota bacterium]
MTRINTNVPSIVAQQTLQRSNTQLNEALTRLSTGLRINTGKDDPAGLIASEVLRSDIVSVERAITNSERANQLIATADSALGQVSSLLNDIRALVSEAANTGALSEEQIAANQLQVDSSLEAIDRISQTTSFQGRRLLDGSLDFLVDNTATVAARASGTVEVDLSDGATSDTAAVFSLSATGGVTITALSVGTAANSYNFTIVSGSSAGVSISAGTEIELQFSAAKTAADIASAINADATLSTLFSATVSTAGALTSAAATAPTTSGAFSNQITVSAVSGGIDFNDVGIELTTSAGASTSASYSATSSVIKVDAAAGTTAADIASAINTLAEFNATAVGTGLGTYSAGTGGNLAAVLTGGTAGVTAVDNLVIEQANFGTAASIAVTVDVDTQATQAQLTYSAGTLAADLVLEVGGSNGFEVFNFGSSTTIDQIASAINLVSDATGVTATVDGSDLDFTSSKFGSDEFVSVRALSGTFETFNTGATSSEREAGTDISARINGVQATGDGLKATINTSTLDLSFNVNSTVADGEQLSFTITGGGAVFQLGPDVVSNQQARVGIRGVSSATLGGVEGTLFELRSGGAKALDTDATGAGKVVEEVITAVTSLRGRLGAFQKATLETNIFSLTEQLENLTEAESSIRDADFAAESAKLTRAQILVQSGTSVLAIANQNPQNVLALLG